MNLNDYLHQDDKDETLRKGEAPAPNADEMSDDEAAQEFGFEDHDALVRHLLALDARLKEERGR
jgi:hypothetical protein